MSRIVISLKGDGFVTPLSRLIAQRLVMGGTDPSEAHDLGVSMARELNPLVMGAAIREAGRQGLDVLREVFAVEREFNRIRLLTIQRPFPSVPTGGSGPTAAIPEPRPKVVIRVPIPVSD